VLYALIHRRVNNTAIGNGALASNTVGNHNTAIGPSALFTNTSGSNNIAFGQNAGSFLSGSSSNNITIGFGSGPSSNTEESNKLYIASGSGVPLIKGDFAAKTVDISGSLAVTGSIFGTFQQITGITVTSQSWAPSGSIYSSSISNANITSNTVVDVIPDNADYTIVLAAQLLPQNVSSTNEVIIFAVNEPTDDIDVTLNLFK
jgi:hypothetical protein